MSRLVELIGPADIARRVAELGRELAEVYRHEPPVMVCVLKGAFLFFADLTRAVAWKIQPDIDFVRLASYGRGMSGGEVKFIKDLETDIAGRHVLVVEDIVDSGRSMDYLLQVLRLRGPASVRICALLDKCERREVDLSVDFAGFRLDKGFVVGYGLDYAEQYRELPGIYELIPEGGG